jgi:O-antigen ligase
LILLLIFLVVLWLVGGASRADVLGQAIVRGVSWLLIVAALVFVSWRHTPPSKALCAILAAIAAIPLLQLIPLPADLWGKLPGRQALLLSNDLSGRPDAWRPVSISPGPTLNAVLSLVVPFATVLLVCGLRPRERAMLPGILLGFILACALLGLLQVSGANINNPFVNDMPGQVGGTFANRNHFALLLAVGCLVAPVWAFLDGRRPGWRGAFAFGAVLLFLLLLLAVGSRAGVLLGGLALVLAVLAVRKSVGRELRRAPAWAGPVLGGVSVLSLTTILLLSVLTNRAQSLDRILDEEVSNTSRIEALPTMLDMAAASFPIGYGLGTFDQSYRIHEPAGALNYKYLNHAHNDYIEIALDSGLLGILVLVAALSWWAQASVRAWKSRKATAGDAARLGSSILLLVAVASLFDYPARTPIIMMLSALSACWLSGIAGVERHSSLPPNRERI